MLFLHDLWQEGAGVRNRWRENPMPFGSKAELLDFWARKIGYDWKELNVTGNDLRQDLTWDFYGYDGENAALYVPRRVPSTRRYLVADEAGRKIDPRTWGLPIRTIHVPWEPRWRDNGAKQNIRRANGPALWRPAVRAGSLHLDEDEAGEAIAVPPVRKGALMGVLEKNGVYDRRHGRADRSWKDTGKTRRQWARHKDFGHRRPADEPDPAVWERLAGSGFAVSPATLELGA